MNFCEDYVADPLYLSLWFPRLPTEQDMMARVLSVLGQFPFSVVRPGVNYLAVHPVSWNEPTILERRFNPGVPPEVAVNAAADLPHEDYAYVFETDWDLWTLDAASKQWTLTPRPVRIVAQGDEFDERASEATGHIEIDFGLDTPFLQEQVELDSDRRHECGRTFTSLWTSPTNSRRTRNQWRAVVVRLRGQPGSEADRPPAKGAIKNRRSNFTSGSSLFLSQPGYVCSISAAFHFQLIGCRRLCRRQTGSKNAKRGTGYVVQSNLVTEFHRGRLATMLAADSHFEVRGGSCGRAR